MTNPTSRSLDTTEIVAGIVSAYVTKNAVPIGDLPSLIGATHRALTQLAAPPAAEPERPVPPVPIRRTVTPDHLISLEDGKSYQSLTRHLSTRGMTPDAYRRKWGLPPDYPMVAPNYSVRRSELARASGLGRARKGQTNGAKAGSR